MALSLQFLGAAGTVTGSRHLLEAGGRRLLVDCGLFQGLKELRLQNRAPFPVDPACIDAVILTHAHLDHSGYLPVLRRNGFRGKVYSTEATWELAKILLADAAHIEEEDADYANRKGYSKHHPALPLFTTEDAEAICRQFEAIDLEEWKEILPGIRVRLTHSGHILGSAFVEVEAEGKLLVFSGDLGREAPLLLNPRKALERADILVLESTYGDRLHPTEAAQEALAKAVVDTAHRRGHLLIPSFSVGRTQDLLHLLFHLWKKSRLPEVPVFLDSPLADKATDIYSQYPQFLRDRWNSAREIGRVARVAKTRQDSIALLNLSGPSIVIAGSGMASGGRILHHLEHRIGDERNMVLLTGFQAAGTRGRLLADGAAEIKMHGRYLSVRAEVRQLSGLSAHADQAEVLRWLQEFRGPPQATYLVHGEPQAAEALRLKMNDTLGWKVEVAKPLERVILG